MRRNANSESTTMLLPHQQGRASAALWGSLSLLGASFVLLVLGPMLLARFQNASENMPAAGYLSMAAASGIALGGGAAMIVVISRLLRDIELRPYASLAPVLAVFAGFVLWGVGAKLPLQGVQGEFVGVFAIMVAVAGGALVATSSGLARAGGWLVALFAPLTLMGLLWSASGKGHLDEAYATLTPQHKMYLGLLLASALVMVVLGEVSRRLARKHQAAAATEYPKTTQSFGVPVNLGTPRNTREPLFAAEQQAVPVARGYEPVLPEPKYDDFAATYAAGVDDSAPKLNVWELHEDMPLPKKFSFWKMLLLSLLVLGGVGAGVYYGMVLPQQEREAEAARVLSERQAKIQAAEQAEAAQKRAAEAKAAAERLEKMLAAPAPAAAEGTAAETAPAAAPTSAVSGAATSAPAAAAK